VLLGEQEGLPKCSSLRDIFVTHSKLASIPNRKRVNLMSNKYPVHADPKLATPLPIASPSSVGFSDERLNRIDPAMQAEIDAGHYAGISVMVARHGKLVKSGF
jgi:hypothetical protein